MLCESKIYLYELINPALILVILNKYSFSHWNQEVACQWTNLWTVRVIDSGVMHRTVSWVRIWVVVCATYRAKNTGLSPLRDTRALQPRCHISALQCDRGGTNVEHQRPAV